MKKYKILVRCIIYSMFFGMTSCNFKNSNELNNLPENTNPPTSDISVNSSLLMEDICIEETVSLNETVSMDVMDTSISDNSILADSVINSSDTADVSANDLSGTVNSDQEVLGTNMPDRSAPLILDINKDPQVAIGDTFDIHKFIGYADDVDRSVDIEVDGEVDTAAEGNYPLHITLRDDAGHSTAANMTVHVVTEVIKPSNNGRREAFADFIERYKTENTSVGIDISRWQETVDFEQVKAAGCEFVYMRIGGYDEGELYTDRYYRQNIVGAKEAGLKIGIYWHAEEGTDQEVRESAAYLLEILDGTEIDYPIAYDFEDFLHFERYGMNLYDLNRHLDIFAEEIEAAGYKACLYNSKYYLESIWTNEVGHPVWLANYTKETSYQGDYFLWQHSNTGRIDGIEGDVDLDVLYIDKIFH